EHAADDAGDQQQEEISEKALQQTHQSGKVVTEITATRRSRSIESAGRRRIADRGPKSGIFGAKPLPDHELGEHGGPAVDKSLKFVFNVDAHNSLVRARGKGKKCGPIQCESAAPDRGRHQLDGCQAAAVESKR